MCEEVPDYIFQVVFEMCQCVIVCTVINMYFILYMYPFFTSDKMA